MNTWDLEDEWPLSWPASFNPLSQDRYHDWVMKGGFFSVPAVASQEPVNGRKCEGGKNVTFNNKFKEGKARAEANLASTRRTCLVSFWMYFIFRQGSKILIPRFEAIPGMYWVALLLRTTVVTSMKIYVQSRYTQEKLIIYSTDSATGVTAIFYSLTFPWGNCRKFNLGQRWGQRWMEELLIFLSPVQ